MKQYEACARLKPADLTRLRHRLGGKSGQQTTHLSEQPLKT